MKNDSISKLLLILGISFIILSIILFNQFSFSFLGIGIAILGFMFLHKINSDKENKN